LDGLLIAQALGTQTTVKNLDCTVCTRSDDIVPSLAVNPVDPNPYIHLVGLYKAGVKVEHLQLSLSRGYSGVGNDLTGAVEDTFVCANACGVVQAVASLPHASS